MELERILERPANVIVAIGGAASAIWGAIIIIPRIYKRLIAFCDSMKEASEILSNLRKIQENQSQADQVRRVMLDSDAHHAYFECDNHGRMVWSSRTWQQITGLNESGCKGRGWENGVSDRVREKVLHEWQIAVDHQRNFDGEIIYIDRDGTETKTHVFASTVRNKVTDEIISFFGVAEIIDGYSGTHNIPATAIPASSPI